MSSRSDHNRNNDKINHNNNNDSMYDDDSNYKNSNNYIINNVDINKKKLRYITFGLRYIHVPKKSWKNVS